MTDPRPCERRCSGCGLWKHHSRFRSWRQGETRIRFSSTCRDCELKLRNERKNEDRPRAIIERRAGEHGRRAGFSKTFMLRNMNWQALVPVLRAMMSPEGLCLSCGHPFLNERDIQIEHRAPPRHRQDKARLHARNIALECGSCNAVKGDRSYEQWLDQQEDARLSNEAEPGWTDPAFGDQLGLFDDGSPSAS